MNRDYYDEFATRGRRMSWRKYSSQSHSTADTYSSYSGLSNKYDKEGVSTGMKHSHDLGPGLCCNIFQKNQKYAIIIINMKI